MRRSDLSRWRKVPQGQRSHLLRLALFYFYGIESKQLTAILTFDLSEKAVERDCNKGFVPALTVKIMRGTGAAAGYKPGCTK